MNESKHISIVIPCLNEEKHIARCLDSIIRSNYNKSLISVIVADGKSNDGSKEIIKRYSKDHNYIHYIENEKRTTPFALNKGIKHKKSDIYIILGAHSEIYPDYISLCVKNLFNSGDIGCVGGLLENISENETSQCIATAMSTVLGVGNATFRTGGQAAFVDTVAFGAYKHEVFETCGYFDEELTRNQDDEFNYRIKQRGFKIYFDPSIKSKYYVRSSFKKLRKQYYQYGYWKVYVNKKHGSITTLRQLIPALFVIYLALGITGIFLNDSLLFPYLLIISLYIALLFSFSIKNQKKITGIFKTIYAYLILHFSYGIGYLEGIIRFIILNKKASTNKEALTR